MKTILVILFFATTLFLLGLITGIVYNDYFRLVYRGFSIVIDNGFKAIGM